MRKGFISNSRKKKLLKPLYIPQDPEERAQQTLIQISNQWPDNPQDLLHKPQDLLITDHHYISHPLSHPTKYHTKPKQELTLLSNSFQYSKPYFKGQKLYFRNSQLKIRNQVESYQVFVGKKSTLNITNYVILDSREGLKHKLSFRSEPKYQCPSIIKNMKRQKTQRTSINSLNSSKQSKQGGNLIEMMTTNKINLKSFLKLN